LNKLSINVARRILVIIFGEIQQKYNEWIGYDVIRYIILY